MIENGEVTHKTRMPNTNRVVELSIDDSYENLYKKMSNMPLQQLEDEYQRYERCVKLSQIIGLFLIIQKQTSNIKMFYDENGWNLSFWNNIKLHIDFDKKHESLLERESDFET